MTDSAFLHGRSVEANREKISGDVYAMLSCPLSTKFYGEKIDTGANQRSVMSIVQYTAYFHSFGLCLGSKKERNCVMVIGDRTEGIATVLIQIPLPKLELLLDVRFFLL